MSSSEVLPALTWLLGTAFAGRVLLSFLPPGLPGRHAAKDLPATWAASHVVGTVAIGTGTVLLSRTDVALSLATLVLPYALLAVVRWLTLPGAMVPRHEALSERPSPGARALFLAAPAALAIGVFVGDRTVGTETVNLLADSLALVALSSFGLARARRAPFGRASCTLAIALAIATACALGEAHSLRLALATSAGAAMMVSWLRTGDRRAAALAAISFSAAALGGPHDAVIGAAGLFALWLHTPNVSKPRIATLASISFALCAAVGWLGSGPGALSPFPTRTAAVVSIVVAIALSGRKRLVEARDRNREPARVAGGEAPSASARAPVDSPRPQSEAIRDVVLLGLFLAAARGDLATLAEIPTALLPLVPLIAVELGLALSPAERPLALDRGAAERASPSIASPR